MHRDLKPENILFESSKPGKYFKAKKYINYIILIIFF